MENRGGVRGWCFVHHAAPHASGGFPLPFALLERNVILGQREKSGGVHSRKRGPTVGHADRARHREGNVVSWFPEMFNPAAYRVRRFQNF